VPPLDIGPGEDQGDAVAVVGQAFHPLTCLAPIGGIEKYAALPRLCKPIVRFRVATSGWDPGRTWKGRSTRVEVELQADRLKDVGGRPPLIGGSFNWFVGMLAAEGHAATSNL
jgi:hypothetical protein